MASKHKILLTETTILVLVILGMAPVATAQVTTGTIRGLVADQSGALIPNATVVVVEQNTGVKSETKTSNDGQYTVPLLKPGVYSVSVQASGFAPSRRTDLTLEIQATLEVDFNLKLGEVSQNVTVVGGGLPALQTASSDVGDVLAETTIETLPLNGRNFSQLELLTPGTNGGSVGGIRQSGNGFETQRAGAEIIGNGGRGSFTNFMIDGLDDRDQSVGTVKVFPLVEGIQEFKVQTSNYDAEFAGGGAVINVTTRSGSNTLYGSAFEFLRNSDLDARQFFDIGRPPYQQNQFGFSLGGPIHKNKTFFFGDHQGYRIHQSQTAIATVPTDLERVGNFNGTGEIIYDPSAYNSVTGTGQSFSRDIIPSINSIADNLLPVFPFPNLPGLANNFSFAPLKVTTQDQLDVRVDHAISAVDSYFARATYGRADVRYPNTPSVVNGQINAASMETSESSIAGFLTNNTAPSGQGTWQETHIFRPNLMKQVALGYTRFALDASPLDYGLNVAAKLGLQGANTGPGYSGMVDMTVDDVNEVGDSSVPELFPQNTWQVNDTLAYVRGAHSTKFGVSIMRNNFAFSQLSEPNGYLDFGGVYTTTRWMVRGGIRLLTSSWACPTKPKKPSLCEAFPTLLIPNSGRLLRTSGVFDPD